jgi:peptidoglycan/xylan/chitin deacetylase (PgdA/CDA1 family)
MLDRKNVFRRQSASKSQELASLALRLGLTPLLERIPRRPGILVINYHRIGNAHEDPYDPGVIEATADEFDAQMASLKKRYALTELAEVQDLAEKPERLRHALAFVTFDDGYRDHYEVAYPILRAHGIRAAFFLATAFVGTRRLPWWDQVGFMVRRTEERFIRVRHPRDVSIDLAETPVADAIETLLRLYKRPETTDPARLLSEIEEACRVGRPAESAEQLFMTWDDARGLLAGGMAVGSHTHSHEILAKLTREQQLEECRLSREILRRNLCLDVDSLALPVGSLASSNPTTEECLRETGYRTAFSYYGGVNTRHSLRPLDVARVAVGRTGLPHYRLRNALAAVTARELLS